MGLVMKIKNESRNLPYFQGITKRIVQKKNKNVKKPKVSEEARNILKSRLKSEYKIYNFVQERLKNQYELCVDVS